MSYADYTVVYEQADDGYWNAFAIDLPVVANADTRDEIEIRIREAIEFHLQGLREDGGSPSERRNEVGVVRVAVPA